MVVFVVVCNNSRRARACFGLIVERGFMMMVIVKIYENVILWERMKNNFS